MASATLLAALAGAVGWLPSSHSAPSTSNPNVIRAGFIPTARLMADLCDSAASNAASVPTSTPADRRSAAALIRTLRARPTAVARSPHRAVTPARMMSPAAVWITGTVVGGTLGTPAVVGAIKSWYRLIPLPTFTPPDRIFAPVWTTLYAMMGLATARVSATAGISSAAVLHFVSHYAVNIVWAPVFFALQKLRLALFMNGLLVVSLAVLIKQYAAVNLSAGLLLLPYMAWLLFASGLNLAICRLNPTINGYNNARWQADLARLQKGAKSIAFA